MSASIYTRDFVGHRQILRASNICANVFKHSGTVKDIVSTRAALAIDTVAPAARYALQRSHYPISTKTSRRSGRPATWRSDQNTQTRLLFRALRSHGLMVVARSLLWLGGLNDHVSTPTFAVASRGTSPHLNSSGGIGQTSSVSLRPYEIIFPICGVLARPDPISTVAATRPMTTLAGPARWDRSPETKTKQRSEHPSLWIRGQLSLVNRVIFPQERQPGTRGKVRV